jgi:hypothetical protein
MGSATCVCSNRLTCVGLCASLFLFLLQENLQIYLKSTQGPIEVYLCPEEGQEPDSPAKEALPSTSALSPIPDCAQPGCSTDSGIAETIEPSGRWEGGGCDSTSSSSAFVGYPAFSQQRSPVSSRVVSELHPW